MIKHIVCFKLINNSKSDCMEAKKVLLSMIGNVPSAKTVEVNIDELHSPRSYDLILEVTVDDWTALENYQLDPYHCDVVKKYIHAVTASSISLDFEV